jgi:hypothetical protein
MNKYIKTWKLINLIAKKNINIVVSNRNITSFTSVEKTVFSVIFKNVSRILKTKVKKESGII